MSESSNTGSDNTESSNTESSNTESSNTNISNIDTTNSHYTSWSEVIRNNFKLSEKEITKDTDLENVIEYVYKLYPVYSESMVYGKGGTCILAIRSSNDNVLKICVKNSSVLKSYETLLDHANKLECCKIPILKPIHLSYENDNFIVYEQEYCREIMNINMLYMRDILKILKLMLKSEYGVTDIYFKNFGIHNNQIKLFDYHEVGYYTESSDVFYDNYFVVQLAMMFAKIKYDTNFKKIDRISPFMLEKEKFGKGYLDDDVCFLLETLFTRNIKKSLIVIESVILRLSAGLTKSWINYQEIMIDVNNDLHLFSHTDKKYSFFDIIKRDAIRSNVSIESICDFGCSLGGIGTKIAHMNPQYKVTLNNITKSELDVAKELSRCLLLTNTIFTPSNMTDVKGPFDVTLYFAILHHILKNTNFEDIIKLVKSQTNKYCIIELPFGDDALLKDVMRHKSLNYEETFAHLEYVWRFINELQPHFEILHYEKLDYGIASSDLNRFCFVLKIKK